MNEELVLLVSGFVLIVIGSVFGAIVYHNHTKYECVNFAIEKNISSSDANSLSEPKLVEWPNGNKEWYLNDQLHRLDGPAREWPDGYKEWYLNGKRHRADGPAIEYPDGRKEWRLNGVLHRLDGPAVEYPDGYKAWYFNGIRHRGDGPAIERINGTKDWWLHGKQYYTEAAFNKKLLEDKE